MNLLERFNSPTPVFFQKARNWGLVLTAISAAVIGLPFALPAIITEIASYVAVAGAVLSGVSQATVNNE
jgi:hypothetical protein